MKKLFGRFTDDLAGFLVGHFTRRVHEDITNRLYGCALPIPLCGSEEDGRWAPAAVLAGVRWNDNPPFSLDGSPKGSCLIGPVIKLPLNQAECWRHLFYEARNKASRGKNPKVYDYRTSSNLLARVHFGDMQFLHAMASFDGEKAKDTHDHIMTWAEFAYRTALGEFGPDTRLKMTHISGTEKIFKEWTGQDMLTQGDTAAWPKGQAFQNVAFGTLLHMIEDSFAVGHVRRPRPHGDYCKASGFEAELRPAPIRVFHAYSHEDPKWHGKWDSEAGLKANELYPPGVVEVATVVVRLYKERKAWAEVKGYIECIFDYEDPDAAATAGDEEGE